MIVCLLARLCTTDWSFLYLGFNVAFNTTEDPIKFREQSASPSGYPLPPPKKIVFISPIYIITFTYYYEGWVRLPGVSVSRVFY